MKSPKNVESVWEVGGGEGRRRARREEKRERSTVLTVELYELVLLKYFMKYVNEEELQELASTRGTSFL